MVYPKIYVGPMTQNVIDSVIEIANETNSNIGFIASRRQVELYKGYTGYDTWDFKNYVKSKTNKVIVCRDHAGLNQGKNTNTVVEDLDSLSYDAICGLDVIHVDPWKKYYKPDQYELGVAETINNIFLVNSLNDNILFEVGTEEAIRPFSTLEFYEFLNTLQFQLGDIFKNVKYAVIQSGTKLKETKNTGKFDLDKLQRYVEICKNFNILSKEHNGDYLTNEEIKIRFENGLDAINIAPEFGVIETKILLDHIKNKKDFENVYQICLLAEKWKKWVDLTSFKPLEEKQKLIEICGHYHNYEIKQIVQMDDQIIKDILKNKLAQLLKI